VAARRGRRGDARHGPAGVPVAGPRQARRPVPVPRRARPKRALHLPARRAQHGRQGRQCLRHVAGLVRAVLQRRATLPADSRRRLAGRPVPVPGAIRRLVAGRADDPDGWAVYKCTWEAGEDDSPASTPTARRHVVSEYRAAGRAPGDDGALGVSAARFADVLGRADEAGRGARSPPPTPTRRVRSGIRSPAVPRLGRPNRALPGAGRRGQLLGHRPVPLLGAGVHARSWPTRRRGAACRPGPRDRAVRPASLDPLGFVELRALGRPHWRPAGEGSPPAWRRASSTASIPSWTASRSGQ
jgi:hypothetical protein